jgi:uncharacterized MnhB-related membrane protein
MTADPSRIWLCILYAVLVGTALAAVKLKSLIASIIAMIAFGFVLVAIFVFWKAPDVALSQAAIGSGLITAFFVMAIHKTRGGKE